jgi:hypothetical protein
MLGQVHRASNRPRQLTAWRGKPGLGKGKKMQQIENAAVSTVLAAKETDIWQAYARNTIMELVWGYHQTATGKNAKQLDSRHPAAVA